MTTLSFTPEELKDIYSAFDGLIEVYLRSPHSKKVERIRKAFEFALKAHDGVRRKSGEPYIHHPIAVAKIVCEEIGLGSTSICSALLHDVIEDTEYTEENIASLLGDKIAEIVKGLTKIKGDKLIGNETSLQAENFRRLIFTMNDDPRVVLIKIADRLHNMRTLSSMRPDKQVKISGETLEFFTPLAHRLGLYAIKSELENLSFMYNLPEKYRELSHKLETYQGGIENFFETFTQPLIKKLNRAGIKFDIKYRIKNVYSIYQKMQRKHLSFEEIYDILAIRIIFDSPHVDDDVAICRQIQSYIEQTYRTRPDRVRDWLTIPKPNGYQALHVTAMLPSGKQVEIQIRSRRMHDIAEQGVAAHWRYKELVEGAEDQILDELLGKIRDILEYPDSSAMEFLNNFKASLYANDIFTFTPKGEMLRFPNNATVLDFAYAVHSQIGDECIGAKIDHKIYPITHVLERGDQVEILNVENEIACTSEWLEIAVTPKAKVAITTTLKKQKKEIRERGEEVFNELLRSYNLETEKSLLDHILSFYNLRNSDEFYLLLGNDDLNIKSEICSWIEELQSKLETVTIKELINYLVKLKRSRSLKSIDSSKGDHHYDRNISYKIDELNQTNYQLAQCCNPILNDEIIGFLTEDHKVCIHRSACKRAMLLKSTEGDRLIASEWGCFNKKRFKGRIYVKGLDTKGLLSDICEVISNEMNSNMLGVNLKSSDGLFEGEIELAVRNVAEINQICSRLKERENILSTNRID